MDLSENENDPPPQAQSTVNTVPPTVTPTVLYCYSQQYAQMCSTFEKEKFRALLVHGLVDAYSLLDKMKVVAPQPACMKDLLTFHSSDYLDVLVEASKRRNGFTEEQLEDYGLGYDCPVMAGIYEYSRMVAGATLQCAKALAEGEARVAFNWGGGWHHANRFSASGFCYVNDCVLAILELKKTFQRILYLDLDIHHGDGVEDAFSCTDSVVTLSFHLKEEGFFPGTGDVSDCGEGRGRHCSLNFPLLSGATDKTFTTAFESVFPDLFDRFDPEAVVVQFGCDGLALDPLGGFNLTSHSYVYIARYLRNLNRPVLVLGGGGYNRVNVAKCWTAVTAEFIGTSLPEDIPEHPNFPMFKPEYVLSIREGQRPDMNTPEYIEQISVQLKGYISQLGYTRTRAKEFCKFY